MNKQIISMTAVAAMAGAALAVESKNVVGFNTDTTGDGCNFYSPAFVAVGYDTVDIQQIVLDDGGAGSIGWGTEDFSIWAGAPDAVAGSGFIYWDASMDPAGEALTCYWGDGSCAKATYAIAAGQGVVIGCAADLDIKVVGQVPEAQQISFTTVDGCNFTGNPFPAEIDIQDIAISDGGAGSIGWGTEDFSIWQGAPDAVAGSGFIYWDASMDPAGEALTYYWGDGSCAKATYAIAPGQGVVIGCGADLDVTIDPPYAAL